MFRHSMTMHRIKFLALLRSVKKNYSIAASIDEEIQRFLKTEAKEAFTKQCVERKKTPTLQVISNAVKSIEKEAGVLVPICIVNKRPSLLFTVRARNLNSHGGEISFPGGKKDSSDKSVIEAALRETQEEISVNRNTIEVFTSLGPFTSRRLTVSITAVIAFLGEVDMASIQYNHNEVSEVFAVPIMDLVTEHQDRYTQFRNGWRMPVFLSKPHHIWGITANITDGVLSMITPLNYNHKFLFKGRDLQNSFVTKKKQGLTISS